MAMFAHYNFFGVLNMFNILPDFVYPIYKRNNNYFFADANEETGKIKEFIPVKQKAIRLIKKTNEFELSKIHSNYFCIGSPALVAFQLNESYLQVGTISELKAFLSTYATNDKILENEIKSFFEVYQKIQ